MNHIDFSKYIDKVMYLKWIDIGSNDVHIFKGRLLNKDTLEFDKDSIEFYQNDNTLIFEYHESTLLVSNVVEILSEDEFNEIMSKYLNEVMIKINEF